MTTLTVYFASSRTAPSSSSSSSTNTNTLTTIQPIRMAQNITKPIPIPTPLTSPNIPIPTPTSSIQTPSINRTPSKRNKTFFERFNQTAPSTFITTPQSPTNQQTIDSINPSLDAPPRLRRRFTFRRSLRHSVHSKTGGDIDDGGIRSVFFLILL